MEEQIEKFGSNRKLKRLQNKRYRNLDKLHLNNIRSLEDAQEHDDLEELLEEEQ